MLIAINGVFAMSEIALVSSRKVRLQQWAEEGNRGAAIALKLSGEPTRFLSTIQIGMTSTAILSGVFGEATVAAELADWMRQFSSVARYASPVSTAVMVVIITFLTLIFGELVPKRIAMHNPEMIATVVARPMRYLSKIGAPLVKLLSLTTDTVLRLIGSGKSKEPSITEEEIRVLMEQGAEEGVFERAEQELVENIFRLDDRRLASIMTPRKEIVCFDLEDSAEENYRQMRESGYSRFPVCKGNLDQIVGMVSAKDMLNCLLAGETIDLAQAVKPPLYVPATQSPMQLLEQFKKTRTHIALVIDEYGELEGLVTMNDVLEAIVGDLPEADLSDEDEIVQREDGSWLIDGMLAIDRLKEHFDIDHELPGEDTGNVNTLGGFVMYQLGRVPAVTDHFEWQDLMFEVVDMDKTRVDKVLVRRRPAEAPTEDEKR
ncbi:hemolysin family protein [Crenobacter sp. SG2303]|uniref:Hemolysin family protein n=1 Tax=Crenobacter oryzisoli TaxID=3056844 RepID=A0ABT7XKJ1_9NEIS|nr:MULTISPECIES: hemolysin family protein [unclassified Crenobacter]MDN0074298.1 hemolysin family protein [Crenobacter sp. SG2303]MDN0082228.1 hemolysin family protein [Crenobacter sp. SG2305]